MSYLDYKHSNIFQSCHLVIVSNKRCDWTGSGDEFTWSCCSIENPCDEKEGDCDSNSECKGKLQCGLDNCNDMNNATHFKDLADCCFNPTSKKNYTSFEHFFLHSYMEGLLIFKEFFM